jgi:hypothetical protein
VSKVAKCEYHPEEYGPCGIREGFWTSEYESEDDFEDDVCFGNFEECCIYWRFKYEFEEADK